MTDPRRTQLMHAPLAAVLCALLAVAVYSNTFTASFQFDDYLYVIDYCRSHTLSDFWPPHGTRYFTYLTFVLNFMAGGLDTLGYHAVNLFIHAANGFLVYLITSSLAASPRLSGKVLPAFGIAMLAALLFISHPVQTEAVTYVTQRFASLATLFYLFAVAMYLKYRLSGAQAMPRAVFYCLALLATYMAQVTKEISYTLPFMMLVLEFAFFTGPVLPRILMLVPFLLAMAVIPWILFGPGSGSAVGGEIMGLQLKDLREISRHDYLVTQFRVLATYLRLLVMPIGQTIDYDYPMYRSLFVPGVFASFVLVSTLFFGAIYLFLRFLKGSSPFLALISIGVFWFFTAISVESSIVPIKDLIFEHRMYLPMAGTSIAASSIVFLALSLAPSLDERKRLAVACLVLVLPLSIAAYARNNVWKNEITLYEDAVMKAPGKERVRYNLAWAYHRNGHMDKAIEQYNEDLKIDPERDKAHYNLALIYRERKDAQKAEHHFLETIRIKPQHPVAHYNLAMLYHSSGDLDRAIASYNRAVEVNPGYEDARYNLAMALMDRGDLQGSISHFGAILTMNPGSVDALYNIGRAYAKAGDNRRAAMALSEALRLRPDFAEARVELSKIGGQGR